MKKSELIYRTLFAFLFITLVWFLFSISDYINDDNISLTHLKELLIKSAIKGFLLSFPLGIWKYLQLNKSS